MGDVLAFPRLAARQPTLGELLKRRTDPALNYFEREQITTCIDAYRAAGHFLTLPEEPTAREAAIEAGIQSLERSLFHALSMQGCPNRNRALMQLLICRHDERNQA